MLYRLSKIIPVPMLTKYRTGDGLRMRCFWIQWRDRALAAFHWVR